MLFLTLFLFFGVSSGTKLRTSPDVLFPDGYQCNDAQFMDSVRSITRCMYDATLEFEKKGRNNADGQYKLEVEYCQVLVEQVNCLETLSSCYNTDKVREIIGNFLANEVFILGRTPDTAPMPLRCPAFKPYEVEIIKAMFGDGSTCNFATGIEGMQSFFECLKNTNHKHYNALQRAMRALPNKRQGDTKTICNQYKRFITTCRSFFMQCMTQDKKIRTYVQHELSSAYVELEVELLAQREDFKFATSCPSFEDPNF